MKLRLLLIASASSALLTALVACTGAAGTELFDPVATSNGTSPGAGSSSSSSGGSGSSSGGSGSSSGGSGSTSGGTTSGGTGGTTSGGTSGGNPGIDAGPKPPAPPNPTPVTGTISCGDSACTAGTQVCCVSFGGGFGGQDPSFSCKTPGLLACLGSNTFACDDTKDCPAGQVCCGTFDQSGTHGETMCQTSCKPLQGARVGILCDPAVAPDQCADLGMACEPSQTLDGYYVCRE